jgi:hypothetical protein
MGIRFDPRKQQQPFSAEPRVALRQWLLRICFWCRTQTKVIIPRQTIGRWPQLAVWRLLHASGRGSKFLSPAVRPKSLVPKRTTPRRKQSDGLLQHLDLYVQLIHNARSAPRRCILMLVTETSPQRRLGARHGSLIQWTRREGCRRTLNSCRSTESAMRQAQSTGESSSTEITIRWAPATLPCTPLPTLLAHCARLIRARSCNQQSSCPA